MYALSTFVLDAQNTHALSIFFIQILYKLSLTHHADAPNNTKSFKILCPAFESSGNPYPTCQTTFDVKRSDKLNINIKHAATLPQNESDFDMGFSNIKNPIRICK